MRPGPKYVYLCPNCGNHVAKDSIISGNSFGAKLYSDGKSIAPRLPYFPDITKCKKCETFFWLSKAVERYPYITKETATSYWQNVDKAEFLEIEDYFNAINKGLAENINETIYIRNLIWWAYNDRIRAGKEIFNDENDKLRWTENLENLKAILDPSNINEKIMLAEINRNFGDFETCISLLQSIDNENLNWITERLINECNLKNKWVVALN